MRKLGLPVNLTATANQLNFAPISPPWLKHLAKEFIKYNMAVHSPGDCYGKLSVLRNFSQFLIQHAPHCSVSDINRPLIVAYIGFLQERKLSVHRNNQMLIHLRTFLETCAYR